MYDQFLRGDAPRVAVSDRVVETVIKASAHLARSGRRRDVDVAVVRAGERAYCCLPDELEALEAHLAADGAESWVVHHQTVNAGDVEGA